MPEDNKETKDSYSVLLEKLDAMEAKYASLEKKYDDVVSFNKALLERDNPSGTHVDTEEEKFAKASKEKFAKMLKGE